MFPSLAGLVSLEDPEDPEDQKDLRGIHRMVGDRAWTDLPEGGFDCTDREKGRCSFVAVGEGDPCRGRWRPRHTGGHIHQAAVGQDGYVRTVVPSSAEGPANPVETVSGDSMVAQMGSGKRERMTRRGGMHW